MPPSQSEPGLYWFSYFDAMENISLSIRRTSGNPGSTEPYWQRFSVPVHSENMSVLDALIWVQRNVDQSLAFRCACRVGMCGTCGNVINGREGLACRTLVHNLVAGDNSEIRVMPMRHLPVVRDLVTDMTRFHTKIGKTVPSKPAETSEGDIAAILPNSRERKDIEPQRECIYCGLCYSACSVVGFDYEFLGPAALNRAFMALFDSRTGSGQDDFQVVANEHGLWRCHTMFECTAVCPKGISPTLAIQRLKRRVVAQKLKRLFRLGRTSVRQA